MRYRCPPTTKTEKGEASKGKESDKTATNVDAANETGIDATNEAEAYTTDLITSTVATDLATPRHLLDNGWVMGASVVATETEEGHMTWKVCFDVQYRQQLIFYISYTYILRFLGEYFNGVTLSN